MKAKTKVILFAAVLLSAVITRAEARPLVVGVSEQHRLANENSVEDRYVRALSEAGYAPVVIPCITNAVALDACVARLDLLVLTGGVDVNPDRYGAVRSEACGAPDDIRDAFDLALVAAARRRRLPIVGICRGCQLLNVAFGGTLWQDLQSEYTNVVSGISHGFGSYLNPEQHPVAHTVLAVPGTRLATVIGTDELAVNSHHHQAVRKLAPGFRVAACSPDGVIEAFESQDYPACGIQFHPEAIAGRGADCPGYDLPRIRAIFTGLPTLCGVSGYCAKSSPDHAGVRARPPAPAETP